MGITRSAAPERHRTLEIARADAVGKQAGMGSD
jgi:hypothetical protein